MGINPDDEFKLNMKILNETPDISAVKNATVEEPENKLAEPKIFKEDPPAQNEKPESQP